MPDEVPQLSQGAEDWVRVCVRAAELRSRFMFFTDIARELGLSSPQEALRAVRQGIALTPVDDIREVRRQEDLIQRRILRVLQEIFKVGAPPPPPPEDDES